VPSPWSWSEEYSKPKIRIFTKIECFSKDLLKFVKQQKKKVITKATPGRSLVNNKPSNGFYGATTKHI